MHLDRNGRQPYRNKAQGGVDPNQPAYVVSYSLAEAVMANRISYRLNLGRRLPRVEDGNFVFHDTSMPEFAEKLSQLRDIDRPVVDRTGIKGVFDITLTGAATAMLQPGGPSLFTLVQEQLGLKLVSAKAPIEVLVVDHAENPSVN